MLLVEANAAFVGLHGFGDDVDGFGLSSLGPEPAGRFVHEPPVGEEQESMQTVDDLEHLSVLDQSAPACDEHDSAGEGCLESDSTWSSL